jgi:5-methylcytosine-specific restriction protein A
VPFKPKKPCRHPGCPELTDGRYCENHKKEAAQGYDPAAARRYNGEWRRIRLAFLAKHPLCEECLKGGRLTPAAEVHHITELASGGTHDPNNLMALCKPCHSRIGRNWSRPLYPQGACESLGQRNKNNGDGSHAQKSSFRHIKTPI